VRRVVLAKCGMGTLWLVLVHRLQFLQATMPAAAHTTTAAATSTASATALTAAAELRQQG